MQKLVHSGQSLFGDGRLNPYELLQWLEPGLLVDVGAAAGRSTSSMMKYSPSSRVIAFEPFSGNWPYFEKCVGSDPRVTLRRRALGDRSDTMRFYVNSVVQGTEPGWETMPGYSSVGRLVSRWNRHAGQAQSVPVSRLDNEIEAPIRMLKMDVQGGEAAVLRGASGLLDRGDIDMIYQEFNGNRAVLEILHRHGFIIFDCPYVTRLRGLPFSLARPLLAPRYHAWQVVSEGNLSTGRRVRHVWPDVASRGFGSYCRWFHRVRSVMMIETDLFCVQRRYWARFLGAAAERVRNDRGSGSA